MQANLNNPLTFTHSRISAPRVATGPRDTHYAQLINPRDTATDRADKPVEDEARQAARSLVSIGLIQPLLAQIRDDPFRSDLFHGGRGEEAFGAKLDAILAERMTQASGFNIVDAVYQKIQRPGSAPQTPIETLRGTQVNLHG